MPQYILREFKVTDARVSECWPEEMHTGVHLPLPEHVGGVLGRASLGCSAPGLEGLLPAVQTLMLAPDHLSQDGQSRTIRQFQFTDWPEQGVPKTGEGFIDFIGQVHKTKEQFGQDGPITVHCRWGGPPEGPGLEGGPGGLGSPPSSEGARTPDAALL